MQVNFDFANWAKSPKTKPEVELQMEVELPVQMGITLMLDFRLKGYVSRQYLRTVRGMVILQLCRWKSSHKETL